MKTPEQWFIKLPDPYNKQAINNILDHIKSVEYETIHDALIDAFRWELTPEGHYYWNDLYNELLETEY
jgi:hypothetical protein